MIYVHNNLYELGNLYRAPHSNNSNINAWWKDKRENSASETDITKHLVLQSCSKDIFFAFKKLCLKFRKIKSFTGIKDHESEFLSIRLHPLLKGLPQNDMTPL